VLQNNTNTIKRKPQYNTTRRAPFWWHPQPRDTEIYVTITEQSPRAGILYSPRRRALYSLGAGFVLSGDSVREEIISLVLCCLSTFSSDSRESHEGGEVSGAGVQGHGERRAGKDGRHNAGRCSGPR